MACQQYECKCARARREGAGLEGTSVGRSSRAADRSFFSWDNKVGLLVMFKDFKIYTVRILEINYVVFG